jgi:trehalose-6-phosphate synthase
LSWYCLFQVVLVQLAVPSRQDVEEYQNLRSTVNELVGRINGRFGTVEFMPIHFMHKSLAFDELCALYAVSDVCLVTSTRDGMNLVSAPHRTARIRHDTKALPLRRFLTNISRANKNARAR